MYAGKALAFYIDQTLCLEKPHTCLSAVRTGTRATCLSPLSRIWVMTLINPSCDLAHLTSLLKVKDCCTRVVRTSMHFSIDILLLELYRADTRSQLSTFVEPCVQDLVPPLVGQCTASFFPDSTWSYLQVSQLANVLPECLHREYKGEKQVSYL